LVVTAVDAEREAFLRELPPAPDSDLTAHQHSRRALVDGVLLTVLPVGAGMVAAAAGCALALAAAETAGVRYDAVLSVGIAGAFSPDATPDQVVLASRSVAADLGAQSPTGFLRLPNLGFGGVDEIPVDAPLRLALADGLRVAGVTVVSGAVLTVNTVTGTAERAEELRRAHPDAAAEAMEGFGVATAAALTGTRYAELRTISNQVGPRSRAGWRIGPALARLAGLAPCVAAAVAALARQARG
jgi:futalosine hydrolase